MRIVQLLIICCSMFNLAVAKTTYPLTNNPHTQGKLLSMAQLTPGNPEYLYAKSLLAVRWNEENVLEYTLPENAADAPTRKHENPYAEAEKIWRDQLPNEEGVVYGESVHRNEFGIEGGMFWSPKGNKLAFYRMDESMVQSYPLVQTDAREAEVKWVKYPMAGMTSHQVTLGIYDVESQKTIYLKTNQKPVSNDLNDPEHYLTCVTWRPDGKQIFIAELNRLQNYMELNCYDAQTGDYVHTLFSLSSDKYVEPEHPLYFLPGSNDKFIWQDERDGWDHLYLYDLGDKYKSINTSYLSYKYIGADFRDLTYSLSGYSVTELLGADNQNNIFFMATSGIDNQLWSVNTMSAKTMRRLTCEEGVHSVKMSPDFHHVYDVYSNHNTPRVCQQIDLKVGKTILKVSEPKVLYKAPNPYEGFRRPEVQLGTLTADDGETDLFYRLVKPLDFDSTKQYPVIVYLYNGPHAQMVREGLDFGLPGWDCYMAQQGYVVFTIDGRGSANRGLAFEQAIWHNLGEVEGRDQMQGVAFLKQQPWVDANRIGIYGWSYGGFMTTYMMLNYPETFKVGVCGGPVLDWSRYEVMYGERYMGTPENNPEGYARNCMINKAGQLKGRLLIIHDDQDATVVPQMSVQFLKNSVEAGTYPDFMLYANHEHNVRGKDRVHLLNRIAQYFIEHL